MNLRYELNKRLRHAIVPVFCACLAAYFGYHAVQGEHGLITYLRYGHHVASLEGERDAIRADRQALEHRVSLLRPKTLDPDLLDERARQVLGYSHPSERVILLPPPPQQPGSVTAE